MPPHLAPIPAGTPIAIDYRRGPIRPASFGVKGEEREPARLYLARREATRLQAKRRKSESSTSESTTSKSLAWR